MTDGVASWWGMLIAVTALNAGAWTMTALALHRRKTSLPPAVRRTRQWLLWLSAAYVLGCGFRSIIPMIDAARLCLLDTPVSRVGVGRSVATVVELCFIAQWAVLMREAGKDVGDDLATLVSRLLLPLIVLAELFSWYAVLTTNYLSHFAENFLWTVSAALLVASFASLRSRLAGRPRDLMTAAIGCGIGYIAFMIAIDLPMYFSRWQADVASGRQYLSLGEGASHVMQRCMVSFEWQAWHEEIAWMTLYFTAGVWFSIALALVPPFKGEAGLPGNTARA